MELEEFINQQYGDVLKPFIVRKTVDRVGQFATTTSLLLRQGDVWWRGQDSAALDLHAKSVEVDDLVDSLGGGR